MSIRLIDCPACGGKVSSQAVACPHCGQPLRPILKRPEAAAATTLSGREAWSSWKDLDKGPMTTVAFSNVRLTSEAILQRVRSAFERGGFSVKQGEVRAGTATTVGGFSNGESGGLVGGITAIDKKTWNPFIAVRPDSSLIQAEVAVLNIRQRMQAQDATSSLMMQDIEVRVRIQKRTGWDLIAFLVSLFTCVIGMFFGMAQAGSDKDREGLGLFFAACFGIGGYLACSMIAKHFFWNPTNVNGLKKAVDRVVEKLSDNLQ